MRAAALLAGLAASALAACGPLGNSGHVKPLAGTDYCLERVSLEAEVYFLVDCRTPMGEPDGGLFKGRVVQIGWDESYIVGWRGSIRSEDPEGWVFLDLATRQLHGPYSDSGFELQKGRVPALRDIPLTGATELWRGGTAAPPPGAPPPSPDLIEDH